MRKIGEIRPFNTVKQSLISAGLVSSRFDAQ